MTVVLLLRTPSYYNNSMMFVSQVAVSNNIRSLVRRVTALEAEAAPKPKPKAKGSKGSTRGGCQTPPRKARHAPEGK